MTDLYVVAYVNEDGSVRSFPTGGGSSTRPSVKAHESYDSAKRSSRHFRGSVVVRATGFEVVK